MSEVQHEVEVADKVHHEVTDQVDVTDQLEVVGEITGEVTSAIKVTGKSASADTSASTGKVTGKSAGQVEVAGEVASAAKIKDESLHAMAEICELEYRVGSHRQAGTQIP
jgi:hypothetical protein